MYTAFTDDVERSRSMPSPAFMLRRNSGNARTLSQQRDTSRDRWYVGRYLDGLRGGKQPAAIGIGAAKCGERGRATVAREETAGSSGAQRSKSLQWKSNSSCVSASGQHPQSEV